MSGIELLYLISQVIATFCVLGAASVIIAREDDDDDEGGGTLMPAYVPNR